jgi:hypothetical protein
MEKVMESELDKYNKSNDIEGQSEDDGEVGALGRGKREKKAKRMSDDDGDEKTKDCNVVRNFFLA